MPVDSHVLHLPNVFQRNGRYYEFLLFSKIGVLLRLGQFVLRSGSLVIQAQEPSALPHVWVLGPFLSFLRQSTCASLRVSFSS